MGILQDDDDDDKATLVPGTPLFHRRLGFDNYEGIHTGTRTGGNLEGPTSAGKDYGKYVNPSHERLLQSKGTSDGPIISWFGDV